MRSLYSRRHHGVVLCEGISLSRFYSYTCRGVVSRLRRCILTDVVAMGTCGCGGGVDD